MSNTTTLTGNIGKSELRHTPSGKVVFSFSVADNIGYGDNQKTQWVQCSIWGKRAENENFTSLLTKGAKVTVIGTLEFDPPRDNWQGGLKMPFVNDVVHITASNSKPQSSKPPNQSPSFDGFDDDIAF